MRNGHSRRIALVILSAVLGLVVLAWWGPRLALTTSYHRYLFVFDITQSMNVRDMAGASRLEAAKTAASAGVRSLPCGSEVGLAIFTQHRSFLLFAPVETCAHFDEILAMIGAVDWRMAWRARSEVAKGLYSALQVNQALEPPASVVFFSDGHEAPPIHPDFPPRVQGEPGTRRGLVVGVGGDRPLPIPKLDPEGNVVGRWSRDEVMQVDSYSMGRGGDVAGEAMVGVDTSDLAERIAAGTEHLSSLRGAYLRELARGVNLDYLRLNEARALSAALAGGRYALSRTERVDVHRWLGICALLLLAALCVGLTGGRSTRHGDNRTVNLQ